MITDGNVKDLMNILDGRINQCISSQLSNVVRIAAAVVTGTNSNGLVSVRLISDPLGGGGAFDVPNKSGENVDIGDNVWIGWFGDLTNSFIMLNNTKAPIDTAAEALLDMTVSATTLAAGSAATVTKTTSGGVVNLAFGIPQGIQGNTGAAGPQGPQGAPGEAIPVGGAENQVLAKSSITDYDTAWSTLTPASIGAVAVDEKGAAGGVATLWIDGKVTAAQVSSRVVSFEDVSRSLTVQDAGCLLLTRNGSDYSQASYTIQIPSDTEVPLPIGMEVEIMRYYPGTATITAANDTYLYHIGKSSSDIGGSITIPNQYGVVALKKVLANTWIATGDIG